MAARVLIIEDNQANMDLLVYLLDAVGHQPLSAFDGEQGVALAHSERPDLIVCDLHLPKLDGHGVLQALRGHPVTRGIPVIAASALPVNDNGAAPRCAAPALPAACPNRWSRTCWCRRWKPICRPRCASAICRPGMKRSWRRRSRRPAAMPPSTSCCWTPRPSTRA
ncbi:response regulator [Massilia sp. MB5]|uniref:response regulator n=1 Tax=Massilia sp. MB5 TaxID=2919578 RepID=UPI001F1015A6|nr:response regulator [Massilia sp. MB5]UMR30950.1 response regulator [Massilia sp. MB5]